MEECRELPLLFYAYRRRLVGNVSAHSHGGCELIYLLRGSCRVEGPLGVLAGRSGQLLVIPPETVHNQIDSPDEKNIFCVFRHSPDSSSSAGGQSTSRGKRGAGDGSLN